MVLASVLPNIVTERLVVRLAGRKDRDAVLDYYRRNHEHLAPFSPLWPADFFSTQYWDFQIERNMNEFLADESVRLFVFEQADPSFVIGNISLGNIVRNAAQFCHLGYGLDENKQGCGYATEAVSAVVNYGFEELKLHRVMANYIPTNEKSGKVLRRVGFTVEGYARDYLYLNGTWQDHILTSMINPRWES